MYCSNCGKEIDDKAVVCVHCGCATQNYRQGRQKDKLIAILLAFFLGEFGVHRFYMNETTAGVVILLNTLICSALFILVIPPLFVGLIWLIELIVMICRDKKDFE